MPPSAVGPTSTTVDRYLESIYCIAGEGEVVRPSRLAAWLGVSAPTVSDALQRLSRDGWIDVATDRSVTLTEEGTALASAVVRRHRVLERWLVDVLGFDWATADEEADALSSACSDLVIDRLDVSMRSPSTCPHGNPIPGRTVTYGALTSLADLEVDTPARVRRISEVAEHEARPLLTALAEHGIAEGAELRVLASGAAPGELRLASGTEVFDLPLDSARWVWIERSST